MKRVKVRLVVLVLLIFGSLWSAAYAVPPRCANVYLACRSIGFQTCSNDACDCHYGDGTTICDCMCCR
jgi:hypothetical protein